MILICNNFVNIAPRRIVTVIALSFGGAAYAAVGVAMFTVVLIIFGEVAPKTFGALYPERIALPAAVIYTVLLRVLYPLVWLTNLIANGVLQAARRLAREGEPHVAELGGAAHRRRRGQHRDSAPAPAHAHEHPRPRAHQRRGHHGAAPRDRRHRRQRRLGRRSSTQVRDSPAHAPARSTRAASTRSSASCT